MLEGARDTLSKTVVRSPIDGIVTATRVEEGEVAVVGVLNQPGTVLLTISDMSVVEAEVEVDETSIPSVKVGQEALVRIDAYPNRTFTGIVTEVGNSPILNATGSASQAIKFRVKIQVKDPPPDIKPGLSVQADILTGFRPQALVVPIQALVVRDIERKPGQAPQARRAARRGRRLPDGRRQGALPGDQDRPPRRALDRGRLRPARRRDDHHRARSRRCGRSSTATRVKLEKPKKDGAPAAG